MSASSKPILTTSWGAPVGDNQNSMSAGVDGPLLLQDSHLIDKLARFDGERIPERVVHAKGAGAHGFFEVTNETLSKFTKAKFLNGNGKRTPVFARFSTVGGEKGSADTARDPRGFAVKFYTEEGIYDMVGNNTPVFFIRDPSKFPDFIHTQKRHPGSNLPDADMFWDFLSSTPESLHQVTVLFSDRGTPYSYRHMNGYSSHTFKFVNAGGEQFWFKWHFKTVSGVRNFSAPEAEKVAGQDPDHATRDLYDHIKSGGTAEWRACVQIMPFDKASSYRFDPFDVTKVWPHSDFPLIEVGRLVLNRNPENYFAETEQSAFSPSHLVPGIEPSPDKMLQGRLFSYPDTHRHRLGRNYMQIPINCPYAARSQNYHRDGFMAVDGNGGSKPNYEPNSFGGPVADPTKKEAMFPVSGMAGRFKRAHPNDDFVQAGQLYRKVFSDEDRDHLISNIAGHLKNAKKEIQQKQIKLFLQADREYGERIAKALNVNIS
eukprot:CAMPEP_0201552474 /NCGR_PEP_ID=MMETSP0173_2-20130828/16738_1 /ASSEMBLY_ACC=CAM_ASM_000268 /TAXON_ID=218659 /ORGANISM="Vexillifera sp., Strain DIVA3 564/2" /LENGTH=486 /DNA_ID=CAMNT_0047962971 /DNA_START=94 /DNA_END=1550 /DNA_ORIENTATION=-